MAYYPLAKFGDQSSCRSLLNSVGLVNAWVAWVRGCVGL